jgi:hypothetical protein
MGQPVRHRRCRGADVHHGDNPLQLVMSASVKEIADADHTRGFSREVDGKSCGGAAEHAGDGIQFAAFGLGIATPTRGIQRARYKRTKHVLRSSQLW